MQSLKPRAKKSFTIVVSELKLSIVLLSVSKACNMVLRYQNCL